jgi:hypothetical protein
VCAPDFSRRPFPDHAPRLEHALRNFDFDAAAETLAEACRQHGVKLNAQ